MNDFLSYTIPMCVIILFIILAVMTVACLISLRFGKFSEQFTGILQVIMVGSVISCGLVCAIMLAGLYFGTQNHQYSVTKTNTEVIITSKSQWIQDARYPILKHENGVYHLEKTPNKTIKISDEKLSELINN